MALDIPTEDFFDLVGHDGSRIVVPGLTDPLGRAGIHLQEAIDACWRTGNSVTPFELVPTAVSFKGQQPRRVLLREGHWLRFSRHIREGRGVIECAGNRFGHAVAFNQGRIFDPDGGEFDYSRESCEARGLFTIRLWRVEQRAA